MYKSFIENYYQLLKSALFKSKSDFCDVVSDLLSSLNYRQLLLFFGILISAIIFTLLIGVEHAVNINFEREQASYLKIADTGLQRQLYTNTVINCFILSLLAGLIYPRFFASDPLRKLNIKKESLSPAFFCFLIGFGGVIYFNYDIKIKTFLQVLLFTGLLVAALRGRFKTSTIYGVVFVFFILAYFLPLSLDYIIPSKKLWAMDLHWSSVFSEGLYSSAENFSPFEAFSAYGVLLSGLIGKAREFPVFNSLSGTFLFLQIINIIFAIALLVIIYQRVQSKNLRSISLAALIIFVLFASLVSNMSSINTAPNLQPVRFLAIPLVLILSYYAGRWPDLYGWLLLGCIAPILALYNFETGIYCIIAFGYALFLKSSRSGIVTLFSGGAILLVSAFIVSLCLGFLIFDGSLIATAQALLNRLIIKIQTSTSGFGGLPFYVYIPILIVYMHCLFLFSRSFLGVRSKETFRPLDFQDHVIIGLIIMIGPYIMNRFHILNMWVPLMLYVILILPNLNCSNLAKRSVSVFYITVVILPFVFGDPVSTISKAYKPAKLTFLNGSQVNACIDGLSASIPLCEYVKNKADELTEFSNQHAGLKWTSGLALTMSRKTGLHSSLASKHIFFKAHAKPFRDKIIKQIVETDSPFYLFDSVADKNIAGIPKQDGNFQFRLFSDAGYKIVRKTKYWVLVKKPNILLKN